MKDYNNNILTCFSVILLKHAHGEETLETVFRTVFKVISVKLKGGILETVREPEPRRVLPN